MSRISVLPFPASLNKANGAQQLTRSVTSAMSDILMRSGDLCTEGLRSPTWVPGWDLSLKKAFMRAITPDNSVTANITTLIDDFFGHVLRATKGGATGPEAFTFLLHLLTMQFDLVDTREGYTKLNNIRVCTGTPFCDFSREFRLLVSAGPGASAVWPLGYTWCWRWFGWQ